jgi:hypothetical protein
MLLLYIVTVVVVVVLSQNTNIIRREGREKIFLIKSLFLLRKSFKTRGIILRNYLRTTTTLSERDIPFSVLYSNLLYEI